MDLLLVCLIVVIVCFTAGAYLAGHN